MRSVVLVAALCLLALASAAKRTTTQKPLGRRGGDGGAKLLPGGRAAGGGGKLKGQEKDFEFARSQDVRLVEGSGSLAHSDDDDGDDDDDEFSGERALGSGAIPPVQAPVPPSSGGPLPPCLQLLRDASAPQRMLGTFVPRCTASGDFHPTQCHGSTGECWCADRLGAKIPGTVMRAPDTPDCSGVGRQDGGGLGPAGSPPDPLDPREDGPDINFVDPPPPYQGGGRGSTGPPRASEDPKRDKLSRAIVGQPGILAGLIGGAVIILLCLILLLMFIVYRVRKSRDQADEKSNKVPIIGYTNAHDRDLYA